MTKKLKKITAWFLTLCMMISLLPSSVFAAGGDTPVLTGITTTKIVNVIKEATSITSGKVYGIAKTTPLSGTGFIVQSSSFITVQPGEVLVSPNTTHITPEEGSTYYSIGGSSVAYNGSTVFQQTTEFTTLFDGCGGTLAFHPNSGFSRYGCVNSGVTNATVYLYDMAMYVLDTIEVDLADGIEKEIGDSVEKSDIKTVTGTFKNTENASDTVTATFAGSAYDVSVVSATGTPKTNFTDNTDKIRVTVTDSNTQISSSADAEVDLGYTITYISGNGGADITQTKARNITQYVPLTDNGDKAGYTFKGWSLTSGSATVNYLPGSEFNLNESKTLYAVWISNVNYKVIFDKNNSSSDYSTPDQWVSAGSHVNGVDAPLPVTSGSATYYFAGWNTSPNGTGDSWNFTGGVVNASLTLYAQWTTVDAYTIVFDDNLADPLDDFAWYTGSSVKNGIAATGRVTAPIIARIGYEFGGWYTDPSCNASNTYNLNSTLNENNISILDNNNDKSVTLYAKWTSDYTSENDVLVDNSVLMSGTFAAIYSDYIDAFANDTDYKTENATPVYRNFYLVNQIGTPASPSSLPAGLHLNSRTGEIYGVPEVIGEYSFYVRIANDEGKWISLSYPISIVIDKPDLNIDMDDDDAGISKIYGSDDTGLYSEELEITSADIHGVVLDADGPDVTLEYDYIAEKAARETERTSFNPATPATLKFAPDLKDEGFGFIPDEKDIELSVILTRTQGEDAGIYKIFLPSENITGTAISMYQVNVGSDLAAAELNLADNGSLTTASEYIYTIDQKSGMSYSNGSPIPYGIYGSGHDVKAVLTSGTGIVNNAGIKVLDGFQSVILTTGAVSTSGKMKAGTYHAGFTPIVINTASPKGTSQSEGATTTANYQAPTFELTISKMELTATGKNLSKALNSSFTTDELKQLISLNAIAKDDVGLTFTSLTVGGINYDLTNDDDKQAADTALAAIMKSAGTYSIELQYSSSLIGADAENYSITAGEVEDAALVVYTPVASGGGGGGLPVPANETINVLVNGKAENAGTAQTTTDSGKTVTKVTVDSQKLEQKLLESGDNSVVTIPVPVGADVIIGELTGEMIRSMEEKSATLVLKTIDGQYSIPAEEIDIEGISKQLGASVSLGNIKVQIEISKPSAEALQRIEKAAAQLDYAVAVPPLEFTITCLYQNKVVEVKNFNTYVERWVALPEGVDRNKITTGIVLDPDGTVRHVPTKVSVIDRKYYAIINSLTNSTYCVVWHPVEFKDTANHWAKESIHDMGSRMVISGVGNDLFQPNRNITRAEFAAIMVRGLGLMPQDGETSFTDVAASSWYSSYVRTASEYGLIEGVGNGRFNPNGDITREQAMAMVARAMTITGLDADLNDEEMLNLLASYGDSDQASAWAKKEIAECVKTGIVTGKNGNLLAPKEKITRAEVAVIIQRHLKESDLI